MDFFDFLVSRWYLSLPLVVTLILWWMYESNKGGKKIGPSEAVELINTDKAIFVDIRDREAFETGYIHGSINIQKDSFEQQEHLLKKDKAVVVISENGLDAGSAGVALQKIGIDEVYLLRNGLISWQEESLPLIK
tara:strand:+ start:274 stop:678 length:405 start_codon:yes stop_codon:yes gene_type:complete